MTGWVSLHYTRQGCVLTLTGHVSEQREETAVPLGPSLQEAGTSLDLATGFSTTLACAAEPFLGVV